MFERFQRLEEIFHEVSALPPEERASAVAERCAGDSRLADRVRALLRADEQAGSFLETPVVSPVLRLAPSLSLLGRRLGAYRIEEKIGQGGMGAVYRAVRADGAYEQSVALKVFSAGADRDDLLARFRTERQILASLEHPGIARLLDGGTTEEGLPYLVMERVDGIPIDRYCDEHRLTVEERLALFLQVCSAVAYAHRHLVVHRDLKPSNILVTPAGEPRLLDFGIAKILAGSGPSAAELLAETQTGYRLLTPQYASPEQLTGGPVTTASDVYSLGVLLYVLLCGRLPYRFDPARPGSLEQAVLEQEAERPSAAVLWERSGGTVNAGAVNAGTADEGADPERVAAVRGMSRRQLARRLAGDLDNIILLALAKEGAQRYASVELLAQDLAHFRAGLPVAARPATFGYRLGKFVRRHRRGVGLGAAALLAIVALAVVMTVQAYQMARQRDAMEQERDKAVRMRRLVEGMFKITDLNQERGETITAREILDAGAQRIETELAGQPEDQASLSQTVGDLYAKLGMPDRALPLVERSLALRRRHGEMHPEVAESLNTLGAVRYAQGDFAAAEQAYRRGEVISRHLGPEGEPHLAVSVNGLAVLAYEQARYAEAETLFRQALALFRRQTAAHRVEIAVLLGNLGGLRQAKGDYAQAEGLYRESLALLAQIPSEIGNQVRAFRVTELNNLGRVLLLRGDFAASEKTERQALAEAERLYDGPHPIIAIILTNLTNALLERGAAAAAEPLAQRVLAIRRKVLPPDHPDLGDALILLGGVRMAAGAPADAEPLLRQARAQLLRSFPADHWRVGRADSELGACLAVLGQDREAEPLLVAGGEVLLGSRAPATVREAARQRLVAFYERRGDPARAAAYRSR